MPGAEFVRVDLHVHTYPDGEVAPAPDLRAYLTAAKDSGIRALAVTDHNTARFAREAVEAAAATDLLLIPGIEVSTHHGHLLGLFSPHAIAELEEFALSLKLTDLSPTEKRSQRAMLDLVQDIHSRRGLAIPAHVDSDHGLTRRMGPAELEELLTSPSLAGLEFATHEALKTWFTDDDPDEPRRTAFTKRLGVRELRERGLARLMSSDAHSPQKVGHDRSSRTLTRLRLDDLNFEAVSNAIANNPKARCKPEVTLPAGYPWIQGAEFHGGFLDGVTLELSPNLNCLIGGRGSGKSTALLAIRAALGAEISPAEDADAAERMPNETIVRFVDKAGSTRVVHRLRNGHPIEPATRAPVQLRIADLGQDESGRLARAYESAPGDLLSFLDGFIIRHQHDETEEDLLAQLADNSAEIKRTNNVRTRIAELEAEEKKLQASLEAAKNGKVELIAQWAALLASQQPLLDRLERLIDDASVFGAGPDLDIDKLAADYGVPLGHDRIKPFVEGDAGVRKYLADLARARSRAQAAAVAAVEQQAGPAKEALARWQVDQTKLQQALDDRRTKLEDRGLKVQAGVLQDYANRLNVVKRLLVTEREKGKAHRHAREHREKLVAKLHANRDRLYELRRATLKMIAQQANPGGEDLAIRVSFDRAGMVGEWSRWLGRKFSFRSPRVDRLAGKITPRDFAAAVISDRGRLKAATDDGGELFFPDPTVLDQTWTWNDIFELETMRLEDRPRLQVQEAGVTKPKSFDDLSAGQQRSVLLSLILCAERADPLVLDQPEDHLDAQYIASSVVRHLEGAKETRQVIIATHSPNLTVLGDAELVIPMRMVNGKGEPHAQGAVDRPETRDRVCALLEGGVEAYRRRGERYGFRLEPPRSV